MERKFFILHDPNAKKPYGFDWSEWLDTGDSVVSQDWSASPTGLTLSDAAISASTTYTWVDGGTDGVDYVIHNDIVTANGLEDRRSFVLLCRDR